MNEHKLQGALVGLVVGDAVGTTLEFKPPGSFEPIADMVGGGPFNLKAGEWTDDTSMALCLADSLIHCKGFDAADQMSRYCRWKNQGYLSSNGRCFDIGNTVGNALRCFEADSSNPFCGSDHPRSAGNGGLMRLAPVVIYYANDPVNAIRYAKDSTRTTHGAVACLEASQHMAELLLALFSSTAKSEVLSCLATPRELSHWAQLVKAPSHQWAELGLRGTGYVVESYYAARFCFWATDNFEDAVLMAANLGDDADTTAAITGQLAGAFYGIEGIPAKWREMLAYSDLIHRFATQLSTQGLGEKS